MEETGSQGRPSPNTGTKDSQLRAVLLTGVRFTFVIVEFALSLANAIETNSFQFNSFTKFIFGGSAAIEVVGAIFALCQAQKAYMEGRYDFGKGGSPIMTVWKATARDDEFLMRTAVISGFGAQAVVLWLCFIAYLITSGIGGLGVPMVGVTGTSVAVVRVLRHANEQHATLRSPTENGSSTQGEQCSILALGHLMLTVFALLAPVVLEIIESFLLISGSNSAESFMLAGLDLVLVIFALPFIVSFICHILPSMWQSAMSYHT